MAGKRKRYSSDFKAKVALEAIRGEQTVAQLAAKHGVHQTMIDAWRKQAVEGMATVFSGKAEAADAKLRKAANLSALRGPPHRETDNARLTVTEASPAARS